MNAVLFAGATEELVFRGWILDATVRKSARWTLILVNALMFLFIHFPIWIYSGCLAENFQSLTFLGIFLLSAIFSWAFMRSRSIWISILLHMYWDMMMFLFY